jgi:hypothetical protein
MGALLLALAIMAATGGSSRWKHVVAFLVVSTGVAVFSNVTDLACSWRARRLWMEPFPWFTRLRRPLWITLEEHGIILSFGAAVGAFASLLGFASVGLGIFITFVGVHAAVSGAESFYLGNDLTFESNGLRVHLRKGSFLVPWNCIDRLESVGPGHSQVIMIHLTDRQSVIDSAHPTTLQPRVSSLVSGGLLLSSWVAGLDGASLMRALQQGMSKKPPAPN